MVNGQGSYEEILELYKASRKATRSFFSSSVSFRSMKTKLLAIMSMIGVAAFSAIQAPSQPSPSTVSAGRTSEKATNPERPGGGHGLVWVNTEARVYHREGSPFYGTTEKGRYMTEQDAIQAGYKRAPKTP